MPSLASLIAAEYAFAEAAPRLGVRDAFLAFLADDAILFRPRPVRGRDWFQSRPPRPGLLTWYPCFARLSRAGDLGLSTGPWEFRPNSLDEEPIAHGYFTSIWRAQADGGWKVEIDCGIGCPAPTGPIAPLRPDGAPSGAIESAVDAAVVVDLDRVCAELLAVDRDFAQAAHIDLVAAYDRAIIGDEGRVYRDDARPFVGRESIRTGVGALTGSIVWRAEGARISRSGDLGYVYGFAQHTPSHGGLVESCYLRVWQRVAGEWRLLIDVDNPIPPERG